MHSLNCCFIRVLIVSATFFLAFVFYQALSPRQMFADDLIIVEEPCLGPSNFTRLILFWTPYFGRADFFLGYGHEPFKKRGCSVDACEATSDRSRLSQADAVVFHIRDLDPYDLPTVRSTCQRWIFFLMETPYYTRLDLSPYPNFFNWTFTYRFDSDIPPQIHLLPKSIVNETSVQQVMVIEEKKNASSRINHAEGKTRVAVWLVSNCRTFSHRERYVNELRKHIQVDVYGECGIADDESVCGRKTPLRLCYRTFEQRYKFYLAFENSLCRDYFSEKLYNIFDYDMVPVVLGKVDYASFVPPDSLVDASQFESPAHLAAYLRRLDEDDDAYNAFFDWKRHWTFGIDTSPWCDVCAKLNDVNEPKKTYADMDSWWIGGGNCTNDVVGSWTIASILDPIVDSASLKFNSLKHKTKYYVKNLGQNIT